MMLMVIISTVSCINNNRKDNKANEPKETGKWEFEKNTDEFGDVTNNYYIRVIGEGQFSNSATTNSDMSALLYYNQGQIIFRFVEYNLYVVKGEEDFYMRIKDSSGEIHEIRCYNTKNGNIHPCDLTEMMTILNKGGIMSVSTKMGKYSESTYIFKIDVSGFDKAKELLLNGQVPVGTDT